MLVIPAIDIKNGKCVRLTQGDFNSEKVYSEDPIKTAKQWEKEGAKILHIVDLDGAKEGRPVNYNLIKQIAKKLSIPVQAGGGIRDEESVELCINAGVEKVILGTAVLDNVDFLKRIIERFSMQIIVSLDCKNGTLMKEGWKKETDKRAVLTALELQQLGLKRIIYTDVLKDGTLTSPNYSEINTLLKNINVPITVAGGISSLEDIEKLKWLRVDSVIVGKALYERKFALKETENVN